jgi:hypothetical protein
MVFDIIWLMRLSILILLLTLLPLTLLARTVSVPPLPVPPYADTEVTTNIAFNARRIDVEKFELSLSFDNSSSNSIQVAFGRDENKDGILDFSETDTVYGWRNGRYLIEDVKNSSRHEQGSGDGGRNFNIKMRMSSDYTPKEFSATDGALQLFQDLAASVPKWLYQPKWNLMRITRRGISTPSEWFSCKIDYSYFYITIR